jgi:hypothetical protein
LPIVLFGFMKYVNTLKITVLFRHYKQATDRNCVFYIWSDKITKGIDTTEILVEKWQ